MTAQTSIDSLEFARKSLEIHGIIAVFDFPRLRESLFSSEGEISYKLTGSRNAHGEPELRLQVTGGIKLVCQRCLGALEHAVDASARFVIVPDEEKMPAPEDERDDVDYMVSDPNLDIRTLIEDEVLLSLPLAPAHENMDCNNAMPSLQEQKESPFKVLKGLKLNKD